MRTKEIEPVKKTDFDSALNKIGSRFRESFVLPPYAIEMSEGGLFSFNGAEFEATRLAARQISKFADVPAGWAVKSKDDKVSKAINLGLQRSKTEAVTITVEDDAIVSVLMPKHTSPSTDLIVPEIQNLIDDKGFEFHSWTFSEEGYTFRITSPSEKFEAKEGDIVMVGTDFLCLENAKRGLDVYPLLFRLICSNGAIAGEFDEETSLIRGQAKPTTIADQIANCALMVDISIDQAKRIVANLRKFPDVFFDEETVELQIANVLDKLDVSPKFLGSVIEAFNEENDNTLWGLYNAMTRLGRDEENRMQAYRLESAGFRMAQYPSIVLHAMGESSLWDRD